MAARVIETTFKARETLRVTTASNVTPLKEIADGTEVHYLGHVIQEITNESTGEIFQSITVKTEEGYLATRSEFFIKALSEIIETIANFSDEDDDEPIILRITHKKSKKGNLFATCELA